MPKDADGDGGGGTARTIETEISPSAAMAASRVFVRSAMGSLLRIENRLSVEWG
jgi:hypothetical protein